MKLRLLLIASLISFFTFAGYADSPRRAAHNQAHREQLAKNQKLDKAAVNSMIIQDVASREAMKGLSAESAEMLDDLVAESNRHLGKRYRHGSKGPNAFDCSGFTMYLYQQFGFNLGPDSRMQYANIKTAVERTDLRKGDLVFFSSAGPKGRITHVGMVVNADNESGQFSFIHASVSRGIIVSSSAEAYYAKRYVGARRVITE